MVEPGETTDEALMAMAAGGDPRAFAQLYTRHVGKVEAFAVRRCARPDEVADLVAAVWLEVIGSADGFDPRRGRFVPWMLGTAANLIASSARRRAREGDARRRLAGTRLLDEDDFARLEQRLQAAAAAPGIQDEIARLPVAERAVAELVLVEGMSPGDAARALGIASATARMRLARGRMKLRRRLSTNAVTPSAAEEGSL